MPPVHQVPDRGVTPPAVTLEALAADYDAFLLDAYGVLVDADGALPGAPRLLQALRDQRRPHAVVTNDASRSPATISRRLHASGLSISADNIFTSGMLLTDALIARGLGGARTCVLGPAESADYARAGGATLVAAQRGADFDVLALCDDAGYDFLPCLEAALSGVVRAVEACRQPILLLPNPDLVYPKSTDELGFTAGAAALMIEAALGRRFGAAAPTFERLGKPRPELLLRAASGLAGKRPVMIGDQLETDIAAACAAGIDSVLVPGVSRWRDDPTLPRPTFTLTGS